MNLLITGAWRNAKEYIKKLENKGCCIKYMQQETESLPCDYPWVEGIICNGIFLTHSIELFVKVKRLPAILNLSNNSFLLYSIFFTYFFLLSSFTL